MRLGKQYIEDEAVEDDVSSSDLSDMDAETPAKPPRNILQSLLADRQADKDAKKIVGDYLSGDSDSDFDDAGSDSDLDGFIVPDSEPVEGDSCPVKRPAAASPHRFINRLARKYGGSKFNSDNEEESISDVDLDDSEPETTNPKRLICPNCGHDLLAKTPADLPHTAALSTAALSTTEPSTPSARSVIVGGGGLLVNSSPDSSDAEDIEEMEPSPAQPPAPPARSWTVASQRPIYLKSTFSGQIFANVTPRPSVETASPSDPVGILFGKANTAKANTAKVKYSSAQAQLAASAPCSPVSADTSSVPRPESAAFSVVGCGLKGSNVKELLGSAVPSRTAIFVPDGWGDSVEIIPHERWADTRLTGNEDATETHYVTGPQRANGRRDLFVIARTAMIDEVVPLEFGADVMRHVRVKTWTNKVSMIRAREIGEKLGCVKKKYKQDRPTHSGAQSGSQSAPRPLPSIRTTDPPATGRVPRRECVQRVAGDRVLVRRANDRYVLQRSPKLQKLQRLLRLKQHRVLAIARAMGAAYLVGTDDRRLRH